jgi:undecaprenyl-diphosphatase
MDTILQYDKELFLALNFDGGAFWDNLFWAVSGKLTWVPLYLLVLFLIYRRYGWRYTIVATLFIVAAVVLADQICNLFKSGIPKLRPTHNPDFEGKISLVHGYRGGLYGTVSAHAATVFAIMTVSVSLVRARWFTVMMIAWALLVCYSRIYIGAHYPLDILFGALTGFVLGVCAIKLLNYTAKFLLPKNKNRRDK